MNRILISIIIGIVILLIVGFIPIWSKPVRTGGVIKVNTWTKIQLVLGLKFMD